MKISSVKVTKVQDPGSLKAYASITFEDSLVVTGFKVVEGSKGIFVSMPSRKNKEGEFRDTVFPVTKEFREVLLAEILKAYESAE